MSDNERQTWTREQLRTVRLAEREMQIANGTVFAALRDEWFRAWPEIAAMLKKPHPSVEGLGEHVLSAYERRLRSEEKIRRFGASYTGVAASTTYEAALANFKHAGAGI
jgi:hypothetical protein